MTKNVSLETAKRLKEAGWPQEKTQHRWVHLTEMVSAQGVAPLSEWVIRDYAHRDGMFAAPDVSELLEALPSMVRYIEGDIGTLTMKKGERFYFAKFDSEDETRTFGDVNPAEALAQLWLHWLELKTKNLL